MSSDEFADFEGSGSATGKDGPTEQLPEPPAAGAATAPAENLWVLCRKSAEGDVETIRAFDDEARARADLELAESVSRDQFWVSSVPLMCAHAAGGLSGNVSRVQALALTWMAQGAEAEGSITLDDPVVVSPRHVRGFVSVPSHEWREMEQNGWVRDGLITPEGADKVGLARPHQVPDED
ncbi:MAG: hypothetical protein ABJ215_11665 [Alphaproteobacteria bacterium]